MANTIHHLIRVQWQKRHSRNPIVRRNAVNLIQAHVDLLRQLRQNHSFSKAA